MAAERKSKTKRKAGGRLKSPSLRLMTVCVVFRSRLHSFCSSERVQRSDYVHEHRVSVNRMACSEGTPGRLSQNHCQFKQLSKSKWLNEM